MAKAKALVKYELVRSYWDGRRVHDAGTVLTFPEGGEPRGSIDQRKVAELAELAVEADKAGAVKEAAVELAAARALVAAADKK